MVFGRKLSLFLSRLRWPLSALGVVGVFALAVFLRELNFSSGFVLYSYLQIVGTLLAFTYAANALLRFRGMHDRLTLILGFGFVLTGLSRNIGRLRVLRANSAAGVEQAHISDGLDGRAHALRRPVAIGAGGGAGACRTLASRAARWLSRSRW